MKKIIGVITALIVVFVGLTIILSLSPLGSDEDIYYEFKVDNGYKIISADYSITVAKDHTATVEEKLRIKFFEDSSVIMRWLPTNSGEQYSDITVDERYYLTHESNFICINIGEDYSYKYKAEKDYTYTIRYKIVPPVRTINKTNYYMNVVPFGWDTSQSDVNVTMTFPFEIKDVRVYAGRYKTTSVSDNYEIVNGTTLTMELEYLAPFSGITVDAELGRTFNVNFSLVGLVSILAILALVAISVVVKLFAIKDRNVFPVLNANPPYELDPAQIGFLIDNNCEPKDITAMIFYFASKGLIRLEGNGDVLVKTGELDSSAPQHQKTIFRGLFKKGDRVSTSQLQNTFYNDISTATSEISRSYVGKLYEVKAKGISVLVAVLSGILAALVTAFAAVRIHPSLIFGIIIPIAIMVVFIIGGFLFGRYVFNYKHKLSQNKMLITCAGAAIIAIVASLIASYFVLGGILPFYGRMIIYAGLAVVGFVCGLINRKTEYYASLMNEITGFKTFLETAEKEKLEAMLEDNPQYFYDILPYANVLGVSDKWENKFKELTSVPPPSYYNSPTLFDFMVFNAMYRSSFGHFTSAMISRPSSSSHSGGGGFRGGFGGGFGGGGFGGGGGGRR